MLVVFVLVTELCWTSLVYYAEQEVKNNTEAYRSHEQHQSHRAPHLLIC